MKAYGRADVKLHSFLTLTLDGGKWLDLRPGELTPPPPKGEET